MEFYIYFHSLGLESHEIELQVIESLEKAIYFLGIKRQKYQKL